MSESPELKIALPHMDQRLHCDKDLLWPPWASEGTYGNMPFFQAWNLIDLVPEHWTPPSMLQFFKPLRSDLWMIVDGIVDGIIDINPSAVVEPFPWNFDVPHFDVAKVRLTCTTFVKSRAAQKRERQKHGRVAYLMGRKVQVGQGILRFHVFSGGNQSISTDFNRS